MWNRLAAVLTSEERARIENAALIAGNRHPTWFPLFKEPTRAVDSLVNLAVVRIANEIGGRDWLRGLQSRLLDFDEPSHASSALAEIRAYGGLLEAGFKVTPIMRTSTSTPDFRVDADDGEVIVEVFAKHQDKAEEDLLNALHSNEANPPGITRTVRRGKNNVITTSVAVLTPAGKPDPTKAGDSVQANFVSRICSAKQDEQQLPSDRPSVLILDLANFGGPVAAELLSPDQAAPLESGHSGITCGAIWHAFYGWKGAPLFEEGDRRLAKMGHDGRFRRLGPKKSKLSAALVVFSEDSVLLENPWTDHRLPDLARLALSHYPWFNLPRSLVDWQAGDALQQVNLHRRLIETMEAHYSAGRIPPWGP